MNFLFTDFRFPRFGCVYRITCIATNRSYVGKTQCLDTRIRLHRNLLIRGGHYSPMMQQDFRTYGIETFQVEVIERKLGLGAAKLECYWMGRFNSVDNGYNTRVGQTDTSTNKRTPARPRRHGLTPTGASVRPMVLRPCLFPWSPRMVSGSISPAKGRLPCESTETVRGYLMPCGVVSRPSRAGRFHCRRPLHLQVKAPPGPAPHYNRSGTLVHHARSRQVSRQDVGMIRRPFMSLRRYRPNL